MLLSDQQICNNKADMWVANASIIAADIYWHSRDTIIASLITAE